MAVERSTDGVRGLPFPPGRAQPPSSTTTPANATHRHSPIEVALGYAITREDVDDNLL